jgi:hypothetical protein
VLSEDTDQKIVKFNRKAEADSQAEKQYVCAICLNRTFAIKGDGTILCANCRTIMNDLVAMHEDYGGFSA